jgi:hypothetical protein
MATASDPWGVSSVLTPLAATHDGSHLTGAALMPYIGSLSGAQWGSPTFSDITGSGQQTDSGNGPQTDTWTPSGAVAGNNAASGGTYMRTTDLSQLMGDLGGKVKAPDWNSFWTTTPAAQIQVGQGEGGSMEDDPNHPATSSYDTAGATKAYWDWQKQLATTAGLDPTGQYIYDNELSNPTSAADSKDTVAGVYRLNNQTGTYDPVYAANQHHNSSWVDNRSDYEFAAMGLAAVLSAGASAGAFGALGAATDSAGAGMSGMDLAADGAASGGNAIGGTSAMTLGDAVTDAKTAYGAYNAANSAAHGDYLGALRGAVGTYAGAGGSDPWGITNDLNTASKAYGAYQGVQNGNYVGALQSGMGAASGATSAASGWGAGPGGVLSSNDAASLYGNAGYGDTTTSASSGAPNMDDSYSNFDYANEDPSAVSNSSSYADPSYSDYGQGVSDQSFQTTPSVPGGTDASSSSGLGSAFSSAVGAASTFQDFLKNNPGLVKTFGSVASLYSAFQSSKSQQASTALQNKAGQAQLDLAQNQWDINKNTFLPKATGLADQAAGVTTAQAANQAANATYNQGVAQDANAQGQKSYEFQNDQMDTARKYASGEMANTFADEANADVQQQAGASRLATEQEMGRRGVNMGSAAGMALMSDNELQTAAMGAGAQTLARRQARDKADSMVAAAGALGTQNFQAGNAAGALGVQNTNSAVQAADAAPATYGAVSNNFNYGANGAGATLGGSGRTGYGLGATYGGNAVADYLGGSATSNVKTGTGTGVTIDPTTGMPKP